jgi:WD40 repeat protein
MERNENSRKIFINNNNGVNFIVTLLTDFNSCFCLKPISEKHKILVNFSTRLYNLEEVYDMKFFGVKDFLVIATHKNNLIIYESSKFFYRGFFSFKNTTFIKLEIRGNLLLANNTLGQIVFWRIDTFEIITWIDISKKGVNIFSLSEGINFEGLLISVGKEQVIKLWKIIFKDQFKVKMEILNQKKIEKSEICLISISKSGDIFATASLDKEIFIWRKKSENPFLKLEKFKKSIWSLKFSPKEELLVTGMSDGNLFFFNSLSGYCLKIIPGHDNPITNCLFSSNGFILYTSDSRGNIKTWKLNTDTDTNTITRHKKCIWGLAVNKKDTLIASGSVDGTIVIFKYIGSDLCIDKNDKPLRISILILYIKKGDLFNNTFFKIV